MVSAQWQVCANVSINGNGGGQKWAEVGRAVGRGVGRGVGKGISAHRLVWAVGNHLGLSEHNSIDVQHSSAPLNMLRSSTYKNTTQAATQNPDTICIDAPPINNP